MRGHVKTAILLVAFALPLTGTAQVKNLTMSGVVTDSQSRRPVRGATVSVIGNKAQTDTTTDSEGSFIVQLAQGVEEGNTVRIRVEKVGYLTFDKLSAVSPTIPLQILLVPSRTGASVQRGLQPIARTARFSTLVPFHGEWKNSPIPMDTNLADPHGEFFGELLRLASRPEALPEGWAAYRERKFESLDEQFAFVTRLVQFHVLLSIYRLQRGVAGGIRWTAGVGVTPIDKEAIVPPDAVAYSTSDLLAALSANEFLNALDKSLWQAKPFPVPNGTLIFLAEHNNPEKGEVFNCIVRLERPEYFRVDFEVQPGPGMNDQLPAGFSTPALRGTTTYAIAVAMKYQIQNRRDHGFRPDKYALWADSLFDGLRKQMAFDSAQQLSQPTAGPPPPRTSETSAREGAAYAVPSLFVECHSVLPPSAVPPEGMISVLQLWPLPAENGGGGLAEIYGIPGKELAWPTAQGIALAFRRCTLTNYSANALLNVSMSLHLTFRRAVKDAQQPGATRSGDVALSRDWPISVPQVGVGPDHSLVFYIFNMSEQFADASFPESATAQLAGENERRTVKLLRSESLMMPLPPRTDEQK